MGAHHACIDRSRAGQLYRQPRRWQFPLMAQLRKDLRSDQPHCPGHGSADTDLRVYHSFQYRYDSRNHSCDHYLSIYY